MKISRMIQARIPLFLIAFFVFLTSCSSGGGSSTPSGTGSSADISQFTELFAEAQIINAGSGGTVSLGALTITFPAAVLPADSTIKISKAFVSNSTQDPSLIDLSDAYVISTISSTSALELTNAATVEFRINPAGFDPANIMLVTWNGYHWSEVPATYDAARQVISTTRKVILPYGTRIYSANPARQQSTKPGVKKDAMTVSEFVAIKVVGISTSPAAASVATARSSAASAVVRAKRISSANFIVIYYQASDEAQARAVSEYMENAYQKIVVEMGFKRPGPSSKDGYGDKWPVEFEEQDDAYARADSGNNIYVQPGTAVGDDLSHTCHHEFTHLVQYKTLKTVSNAHDDGMSWFDETMADAIGFYAQKGLGVIYASADTYMGDFDMRLDSDEYNITDNDDYEYVHFPFISYLLHKYGPGPFRQFFEFLYTRTPGKTAINLTSMDTAALEKLTKTVSGRNGIFWDFYRDYFIAGNAFNKIKFLNLPNRTAGSPLEITEDNHDNQGATIVSVLAGTSETMEFTMLRLSGKALILRYAGGPGTSVNLKLTVTSQPGQANGRIELVAFKRVGGILQTVGASEEVGDGAARQITYTNFGTDTTDVYVVMANTSSGKDDYKVIVGVSIIP